MKAKYHAQFNKSNGKFITIHSALPKHLFEELNHELYLWKDVELDPETQKVKGDYHNCEVVNIADEPLFVREKTCNILARDKITAKYPVEKQINIIGDVIERLSAETGVACKELKEMRNYVNEILRENKVRKTFYQNDPDYEYLSEEQEMENMLKDHEGGLMEYDERAKNY